MRRRDDVLELRALPVLQIERTVGEDVDLVSRATISVRYFFWPLSLSSQLSVRIEPSMKTSFPLRRYWPQI